MFTFKNQNRPNRAYSPWRILSEGFAYAGAVAGAALIAALTTSEMLHKEVAPAPVIVDGSIEMASRDAGTMFNNDLHYLAEQLTNIATVSIATGAVVLAGTALAVRTRHLWKNRMPKQEPAPVRTQAPLQAEYIPNATFTGNGNRSTSTADAGISVDYIHIAQPVTFRGRAQVDYATLQHAA